MYFIVSILVLVHFTILKGIILAKIMNSKYSKELTTPCVNNLSCIIIPIHQTVNYKHKMYNFRFLEVTGVQDHQAAQVSHLQHS